MFGFVGSIVESIGCIGVICSDIDDFYSPYTPGGATYTAEKQAQ